MKKESIIGKEFIGFKFPDHDKLKWSKTYELLIDKPCVVLKLHDEYPEYAYCEITLGNGKTTQHHYPTGMIKKQIEENEEPIDINALFEQIKNI